MYTLILVAFTRAMIQVGDYKDLHSCQNAATSFMTQMTKDWNGSYAYCIPAPDQK